MPLNYLLSSFPLNPSMLIFEFDMQIADTLFKTYLVSWIFEIFLDIRNFPGYFKFSWTAHVNIHAVPLNWVQSVSVIHSINFIKNVEDIIVFLTR